MGFLISTNSWAHANVRGRPKPIYAHSAVTETWPKLRFQLRP